MELTEDFTVNAQKLIHPELLSRNELHEILLSRCVQKQHLEGLEKVQLVDLFQRIVMPLPQRIYNDKRRGKMLNQIRSKKESHGKNKTTDSCINLTASQSSNMKNMSFESKQTENKGTKNSLDHIIINDRRKIPRIDKESPKVCDSLKDVSLTTEFSKSKTNTVVKLKRRDTNSSKNCATSANEEEEEGKKKKRRIVWP